MKKLAKELKKGDKIIVAGKLFSIEIIELSEIGKQGTRKVRLELVDEKKEKIVIIRPEDYPFEVE